MIYFVDKGPEIAKSGENPALFRALTSDYISEKALERRAKNLPADEIITYEDLPVYSQYINSLNSLGIEPVRVLRWFNAISGYLNSDQVKDIKSLPFISKIEKVKKLRVDKKFLPAEEKPLNKISSANYSLDYGFSLTQNEMSFIPQVHELGFDGSGVLIGVLDTGFDWAAHDALKTRNVVNEYDFVFGDNVTKNESNDSPSQHNHGTYVFSILAGYLEGAIVGPAYDASFLLAKTENVASETHAEEDDYAAAMEWMENQGVDITTSSLGYSEFDDGEQSYTYQDMDGNTTIVAQAAKLAFSKGVVTVTSAGNEGSGSWYYITSPGDEQNILTVGAVSSSNSIAGFSSRGPTPDGRIKPEVTAMGVSVFGARATVNDYQFSSGTSSAAPIIAGITGLLLDVYPHLTNRQVRKIMIEAGDNVDSPDNDYGYGLVSALRAISFPNIKTENNEIHINKLFADSLLSSAVVPQISLSYDGSNFTTANLSTSDNLIYSYNLGTPGAEDTVRFHFTYTKSSGGDVRVPASGEYKFIAGSDQISLVTGLEIREPAPDDFYLYNNYPNPFNISTKIEFYTERVTPVELSVYDILGQKVKTIYSGTSNQGYNTFNWNGRNEYNGIVSSGVYYYVLKAGDKIEAKNMVLLK
ncbi:MAG: hypothetical protein SCALA702_05900 [Melioribacteraceae bacterium]|nr:MAG: hypothetical protein SCALA702_05900 [Melioribacteraceae bacterium]